MQRICVDDLMQTHFSRENIASEHMHPKKNGNTSVFQTLFFFIIQLRAV